MPKFPARHAQQTSVGDGVDGEIHVRDPLFSPQGNKSLLIVRGKGLAFIDENLFAATLQPATVAQGIHVSRAVLYRAFQELGGVASLIHRKRLEQARVMLKLCASEHGIIIKVARATGYSSVIRFSRLFAMYFSEQPSDFIKKIRRENF